MKARRYAETTTVPVDRSRAEINRLLAEWHCSSIGWTDHLIERAVSLAFPWHHDGALYKVRLTIGIPTKAKLEKEAEAAWPNYWQLPHQRARKLFVARGLEGGARAAHRLLLLKLKADLNAARQGLAKAEEIFLPWLVDANGRTVSDVLMPRLRDTYALPANAGPSSQGGA